VLPVMWFEEIEIPVRMLEEHAQGLNLPGGARAMLGLAPLGQSAGGEGMSTPGGVDGGSVPVGLPRRGGVVMVSRRVVLAALGVGSTASALVDVREATAGVAVDEGLLAELTDGLAGWQVAGRFAPPSRLVDPLVGQVAVLDVVRRRAPADLRRDYLVLAAQYGEYLSWMVQEAGDPGRALYWVDRAQNWAGLAEWPAMTAYAHVRRSTLASSCAEDGPAAVEHAAMALRVPETPTRVRAEAARRLAYGHALAGDRDASHRALDQLADLSIDDEGPDPIIRLGASNDSNLLARSQGTCDLYLGDGENAIAQLSTSHAAYVPSSRSHAITGARLAQAYALAGDPDRACGLALESLDAARHPDSLTTRTELRRTLAPLSRRPGRSDVTEVTQRITALV
jgi:hypothetical protein